MMRMLVVLLFGCMLVFAAVSPCFAQSIQEAAAEVEAAIQSALSSAGQTGQPSMRQLGGVEAGATGSESPSSPSGDTGSNDSGGGG